MDYQWDVNTNKKYKNRMGTYKTKKELNFILENLDKNNLNILDIGGGTGRFAIPLINKGHKVYVVDINKEAINLLPNMKNLRKKCIDFMKFKSKEKFNIMMAIELIDYIANLNNMLSKVNKLLKLNGILIFTAVNKSSIKNKIRKCKKHIEYYNELSIDEFREYIEKKGFILEKIEGFNWQPFRAGSNNSLVNFFALIEGKLGLKKWLNQSPWLLFKIRKIREI